MILEAGKIYEVVKTIETSKPVLIRLKGDATLCYDTKGAVPNPTAVTDLYQDTDIGEGFAVTNRLEMCDWVGYIGSGLCEIKNIKLEEKA